jgi:hypothetical protein
MADKPTLYQPFQPPASGFYHLSELNGSIGYDVPSKEPENPDCPKGEWYCQNSECVVRTVTIFCKLHGEDLPKMRCPACRQLLKFHHWLRHEILVPYKEDSGSAPCRQCQQGFDKA